MEAANAGLKGPEKGSDSIATPWVVNGDKLIFMISPNASENRPRHTRLRSPRSVNVPQAMCVLPGLPHLNPHGPVGRQMVAGGGVR